MKINTKPGRLIWITGLAGAGKSTIGRALTEELRKRGETIVFLDGDEFRKLFGDDLGHEPEDRLKNAWRIAHFGKFLAFQGVDVVCATVSLYKEVRKFLRNNVPTYFEVYVKASMETLRARDQKGLYSGAEVGKAKNVAGINLEVDLPTTPDLIIDNEEEMDISKGVEEILKATKISRP